MESAKQDRPLDACTKKWLAITVQLPPRDETDAEWDAILVDDDPLVHHLWRYAAAAHRKRLAVFSAAAELLQSADLLAREIPVYVDANLGTGVSGVDLVKSLRLLGFTTIFLATGYEAHDFAGIPWINAVVGKEPPWSKNSTAEMTSSSSC